MPLEKISGSCGRWFIPAHLTVPQNQRAHYVALGILLLVIAGYNALFVFSFLPITEGWFSAYAQLILQGQVPYRDFYLYLTPAYPMMLAGFISIFGDSIWALRFTGVLVVMAIAALLYRILSTSFSAGSALFGALVAMVYYQSGVAFIPYDFTQLLTLFTLAAMWMMVRASQALPEALPQWTLTDRLTRHLFLAGLFASLAFLTKQSNGTFVVLGTFSSCGYLALFHGRKGWHLLLPCATGAAVFPLIVGIWLFITGALVDFWDQIYYGALAAKGGAGVAVFSWINGLLTPVLAIQMRTVIEWILITVLASATVRFIVERFYRPSLTIFSQIATVCCLAILVIMGIAIAYLGQSQGMRGQQILQIALQVNNYLIPISVTVTIVLLLWAVAAWFITPLRSYRHSPLSVVAIFSFGMIFGNGTSAGISEVGVFVMLALAIAAALDSRAFSYVGFGVILVFSAMLVVTFADRKFSSPYAWWGVAEPDVRNATVASKVPMARGLKLSPTTAADFHALADSLERAPQDGDVFAFPNIPSVYLISNRWPDSRVIIPWFDFLPDQQAREEALRLLNHPPAVIVNLRLPSVAWDAHERLFRNGHAIGQQDIDAAITTLTQDSKKYRLDLRLEVSPGSVLDVWHRNVDVDRYGQLR